MRKLYFVALALVVAMGFLATPCAGPRVVKRHPREEARKSPAATTDAILCYGGSHHRTPYLWDQARLARNRTNGFYDLWASPDEEDRKLYHELCQFVIGNPLRKQPK